MDFGQTSPLKASKLHSPESKLGKSQPYVKVVLPFVPKIAVFPAEDLRGAMFTLGGGKLSGLPHIVLLQSGGQAYLLRQNDVPLGIFTLR